MTYVAIDPAAVSVLATELDAAAEAVDRSRLAVDRALRSVGRGATAPARLAAVAETSRGSAADLRRRVRELNSLQVLYRRMGESGPVYPRPDTTFPTFAAAEAAGEDLAARFAAVVDDPDAFYDGDRVRPLLDELGEHALDPHFCRAFFDRLDPRFAMFWIRQFGTMSAHRGFPWRDDAVEPFLTAMGTGLNADPALLARYVEPMKGMLAPGDLRDVLRYGTYDDDTVLDLIDHAMTRYLQWGPGMDFWGDDEGLLDPLLRDDALARRFLDGLSDDEVRSLMAIEEGLLAGFGSVAYVAGAGADPASLAAVERLVVLIGSDDTHLAPDVQTGIARALGQHLDEVGGYVARGVYPGDLSQDDLVDVFVRLMTDNDTSFAVLHEAGADLTRRLLATREALAASSPDIAALGGVYGLLARADADDAIGRAEATAGWWAMAAQGVGMVPLPGPALAGTVVKKTFAAVLSEQAAAARARGQSEGMDFLTGGYDQGRLLLAVALWQYDQRQHPDTQSALTPPPELRHDDGTLKVFAELDSAAERAALRAWLEQPTPYTVRSFDGSEQAATLDELVRGIDDEFVANFQKVLIKP
jgi:hypothetical protein